MNTQIKRTATSFLQTLCLLLTASCLLADGGVTYRDIAAEDGAGITYRRAPSAALEDWDALRRQPDFNVEQLGDMPTKVWGAPGVAILDFDGDGDLDIYVTNGPGAANSLYANQLRETGEVAFVDVAEAVGVAATAQDSTGVCAGDLDNDGDPDLVVVSHNGPTQLFENLGGTFADVSEASGVNAGGVRVSSGCSLGDVDLDGRLDLAISNTFDDWNNYRGIRSEAFALNEHNRLFRNQGGLTFFDVSAASGVENLDGFPAEAAGSAGLTWALALVDIDADGDVDLLNADDQAGIPDSNFIGEGGIDRGMLHLLENDGRGVFDDRIVERGLAKTGDWMSLSFGDLDCNGTLDFFASNFGDYVPFAILTPGRRPSRWFLQNEDGTFTDPGVGDLVTTPFGWGSAVADYDNDGDLDIVFHGSFNVGLGFEASNDGVILQNPGCSAEFTVDQSALAASTDHGRREVHGMAMADLDENGFLDIVSVSAFNVPTDVPFDTHESLGSPFDDTARFLLNFDQEPVTGDLTWRGVEFDRGTLSVELATGNDYRAVRVRTVGGHHRLREAVVNRDGVGAVVRFTSDATPEKGMALPVVAGSGYASQGELTVHFGLADATSGTVEVLWPGGVKNRLYDVRAGETVTFPEIPCPFDDPDTDLRTYLGCVLRAVDAWTADQVITADERSRFLISALRARREAVGARCAVDGEIPDGLLAGSRKAVAFPALGPEGSVTFTDIAAGDGAGITYRRTPSPSKAKFDAIKLDPPFTPSKWNDTPIKSWGAPGVALVDVDGDDDLDIYVTNGPGTANSLYQNQLMETGEVSFVDIGEAAGVGAFDQDSTGVCFGDIDNDGDPDFLVLSHDAPNRLFENQGDGTFLDITDASGVGAGPVLASSTCSMGDVDGDGLLDLAIANTYDEWSHSGGLNVERYALNQHNQLLKNQGGNVFVDVSAVSGIENLAGFAPEGEGAGGLTWFLAMVDLDLDGDLDLLNGDDQSGFPTLEEGGVDRGLIHLFENDGRGQFQDVALEKLGRKPGAWMGVTFGDYNCDGALDFFGANFGDYNPVVAQPAGRRASRWFFGSRDGSFDDPGVGALQTTPFGWGSSTIDYDNDGDQDIVYHGGMDIGLAIETSNPGVVLRNPGVCTAAFEYDGDALGASTDHQRRNVQGMAVGDLDKDGFLDIVSVSNFDIPPAVELTLLDGFGSPFDPFGSVHFNFLPDPRTQLLDWVGSTFEPGTLSVELANGNGNRSLEVETMGGLGLVEGARVNRDGIGAVLRFRGLGQAAPWTLRPVVGGASYASQDQLAAHFGLGQLERGVVEVLWPGGTRNRLYNVKAGERVTLPEIPCSFDDDSLSLTDYLSCVLAAFDELQEASVLRPGEKVRFLTSALQARRAEIGPSCADDKNLPGLGLDVFDAPLSGLKGWK